MDIAEQVAILLGKQLSFREQKEGKPKAYFDSDNHIAVSDKKWVDGYTTKEIFNVTEKKVAIYQTKKKTFVVYYFNGSTIDMNIYDKIATLGIKKIFNMGKQGPVFLEMKDDVWISIAPLVLDDDMANVQVMPTKIITFFEYTLIESTLPKKLKGTDRYNEILNKLKYKTSSLSGLR